MEHIMQTKESIKEILSNLKCGFYQYILHDIDAGFLLQLEFFAPCTNTGTPELQRGRQLVLDGGKLR